MIERVAAGGAAAIRFVLEEDGGDEPRRSQDVLLANKKLAGWISRG